MLSTIRFSSSMQLTVESGRKLVSELVDRGYQGLLHAAEKALVEAADLPKGTRMRYNEILPRYYGFAPIKFGEVFICKGYILYFIEVSEMQRTSARPGSKEDKSEFGIIGHFHASEVPQEFWDFAATVKSLSEKRDNQDNLDLDVSGIEEIKASNDPKGAFRRTAAGRDPKFCAATYDDADLEISELLGDRNILDLARRVSQSRSVPSADIDKAIADTKISQEDFERLTRLGFFVKRAIVECRQQNVQIVSLSDGVLSDELFANSVGVLNCPKCGKSLSEERLGYLFDLGLKGKQLIQKSHWLTILVTNALIKLGIDKSEILWNVEDGADEVDIITIFRGQAWVFELKDRAFGAGDAHPFSFRRSRFSAEKAYVVTTENVSTDAKEVFKEVYRRSKESSSGIGEAEPIYIEGLEQLVPILAKSAQDTAVQQARSALSAFGFYSGYDVRRIIDFLPDRLAATNVAKSVSQTKNLARRKKAFKD